MPVALVDCNNFYVSCERVFNPRLAGRPVVVLSNNDGNVVSRSNEAKKIGIGMGVPAFQLHDLLKRREVDVFSSNYTLYADISDPDNWILIVNKQVGQWGLTYDKAQDLGRVKMTMKKPAALIENLKYTVTEQGASRGTLELAWENHVASVPLTVK